MENKIDTEQFFAALQNAGLIGLPFSWTEDGRIEFDKTMSVDDMRRVIDVLGELRA